MARGFGEGQYRSDARVSPGEVRGPLVAGTGGEDLGEGLLERGPCRWVASNGKLRLVQPETVEQRDVELPLDRTDRDELSVGARVDLIERRPRVGEVHARLVTPLSLRDQAVQHGRE